MSTRDDWYRKETWSAADAAEFERRLKRSRGQRTQYLKLQAWHLAQTRKASLAAPAIALANKYLEEDPTREISPGAANFSAGKIFGTGSQHTLTNQGKTGTTPDR
jgi:hypothetical protein